MSTASESSAPGGRRPLLAAVADERLRAALDGPGLTLDLGAAVVRVRGDVPGFAAQLRRVYPAFGFDDGDTPADVHAWMERGAGLRRWLRPQVRFRCDGRRLFEPFAAHAALPHFEWSCNWYLGQRCHHVLLLHAGALERDGLALVLPAMPGSGKSTLTAALAHRGWRLLSDEFGAVDAEAGVFRAMLKPVALKNTSIAAIRAFAPEAAIGPVFKGTRRGDVAHVAAPPDAAAARHRPARPGAFLLPRWTAGAATRIEPVTPQVLFGALALNAFNYEVLGAASFAAVAAMVRDCPAWTLQYSELDDAVAAISRLWAEVRERAAARDAGAAAAARER